MEVQGFSSSVWCVDGEGGNRQASYFQAVPVCGEQECPEGEWFLATCSEGLHMGRCPVPGAGISGCLELRDWSRMSSRSLHGCSPLYCL